MVLFHIITKIQSFYKENLKDYNNETIPNKEKQLIKPHTICKRCTLTIQQTLQIHKHYQQFILTST